MKKLYSLFALGALLFAACSDNASQISGSTSVPNMGNNVMPQSPVLCSVLGVTDSLEAIEKGCIWSPEMWSRTSGYRVRTGYDNGTNTSGNVEEADVSAMQGICVEYSGNVADLELLPNDSIADLLNVFSYTVSLRSLVDQDEDSLSESKEMCFPWYQFGLTASLAGYEKMPKWVFVPIENVVAHLKGVRLYFHFSETNTNFNIISIGRYHLANPPTTNLHPVNETCEPIAVLETFCEYDYSEEKAFSHIAFWNYLSFADKKYNAENDSVPLSDSSKKCLKRTLDSLSTLHAEKSAYDVSRPCDNPQPLRFSCADGTESESLEYAEIQEEFSKLVESLGGVATATDSLFNHCMSLNN